MIDKIVIHKGINKYLNEHVEIRLDYISAICDNIVIPIYYYNHKQKCYPSDNECTMTLKRIQSLNKNIINQKLKELEGLGFTINSISLTDNLHTHPHGIIWFSPKDYNGSLQPDYLTENTSIIGSNMLFSYTGEFYKALLRTKEPNEKYKYKQLEAIYLKDFEPYYDIDISLFKIKWTKHDKHNKNKR